jgi:hypothetical protein
VAQASGTYLYSDPESVPVDGIRIDAWNATGAFSGVPLAGPMELRGAAKICIFGSSCGNAIANLEVPLSLVGQPGTHTLTDQSIGLTVVGAPWTTGAVGTAMFGGIGSARGPLGGASSTASPGGRVALVTPTYIRTSSGIDVRMITRLTVEFVPEPATILLVGGGVASLVAAGRRRQRSRIVSG